MSCSLDARISHQAAQLVITKKVSLILPKWQLGLFSLSVQGNDNCNVFG
jgi:hypothetical protein